MSKLFSSASATKIFACSTRHDTCARPAVPRHAHPRTRPSFVFQCKACVQMKHVWPLVSSAHASTATATASLYFLSALYCSALPPRCIFLHICLWPRRQWSCWQVLLQYLNLHLTHRGASWASGAAQAGQVVRIILRWRGVVEVRGGVRRLNQVLL